MNCRSTGLSVLCLVVGIAGWLVVRATSLAQSDDAKQSTSNVRVQKQSSGTPLTDMAPERALALAKTAAAQKVVPTPAELNRQKLNEPMPFVVWQNNLTLEVVLHQLEQNHGFPRIMINHNAFKEENPDVVLDGIGDTPIKMPNVQGISKARVLRLILDQIPTNNGAFLVRPDCIEILTNERSLPESQFIEGTFQDIPLVEVLADLSERSGLSILIDARAGEKAKSRVNARFQQETNLATAVRLLADMADLKLVIVDRVLYVTLPSNETTFPPGNLPAGKQKRIESA
jgi:hypothetical protein